MKKKVYLLVFFIVCAVAMAGCGSTDNETVSADGFDFKYTEHELDPSYDESAAEKIVLEDEDILITEEGTYILSGKISDGQIVIETSDTEKVQLVLDGVEVECSGDAPVYIKESDKVFITLADGSINKLTGPSAYSEAATGAGTDGVIHSKADLCINGEGSLEIEASVHGIVSKDDLVITGGNIRITAAGDGLQGKDCVKVKAGKLDIVADNDAIKSTNTEDEYRGFVSIDGGEFDLTAGYDGIQAENIVRITGGDLNVETGGGSKNASTDADWGNSWGGGPGGDMRGGLGGESGSMGGEPEMSEVNNIDDEEDEISAKGIKAGKGLFILGGAVDIDSSDDAVHSNGYVSVEKGTMNISSGDDGIHADSDMTIKGGNITIVKSYEGLEGNTVTIDAGIIDITASDDGLNAAGGSDNSSMEDRPGANSFDTDESAFININGGELTVHANGDGMDSNGNLKITGGNITVSCPTKGDTAVLDYGLEGSITGGTFVGTGAVQMAQTFRASEQGVLAVNAGNQKAGTDVRIINSDGNEVMTYTPDQSFAVVIISSPDIVSGETYTIEIGDISGDITAS